MRYELTDRAWGADASQQATQRSPCGRPTRSQRHFLGLAIGCATPSDDNAYLLDTIENGRVVRDRVDAIAGRLGATEGKLVLCGHSHRPDVVQLPGGPLVLNPGSVGCPAYEDGTYVSESGSPHARYAIVEARAGGEFAVDLMAVPYANEDAARRAEESGRPEWAHGLRTGFMPPLD